MDVLVKDNVNNYLLLKRANAPLKGVFYLPGGRVHIKESSFDAAKRKLFEETGLIADHNLDLVGIYEDFFDQSNFEVHTYHTLSLVYLFKCDLKYKDIKLDNQSSEWILSKKLPDRFIKNMKWFKNV